MVLRPVELNTTGDPGACQSDESRLDYMVVVNEIIVSDLVVAGENFSSDGRQNLRMDIFVFQRIDFVAYVNLFICNTIGVGKRIETAGSALIRFLFEKHGKFNGSLGDIGGDGLRRPLNAYFLSHSSSSNAL